MPPSIPPAPGELSWRVARSCDGGSCVRIAPSGDMIIIGDSKDPGGPVLTYSRSEWRAFAEGLRHGEFDDLM